MVEKSDIKGKTISDLPSEVLSHIFSYLPYNIKVIRLVCSKWNESCNIRKISGNEKIHFRGMIEEGRYYYSFLVEEFSRNIFNLQLTSVIFKTYHVPFWMKFGHNLRSITLVDCSADENLPILQFCKNLNTLILDNCSHTIIKLFRDSDGNFVQTNVVSLTIKNSSNWSDETLDGCFRICPHLCSLTLNSFPQKCFELAERRFYSFKNGEDHVFNRSDIFSFSCIRQTLEIRAANIIELNLESVAGILRHRIEQIASIPNLKLRKLNFTDLPTLTDTGIYNFVILQPDLQSITIRKCSRISPEKFTDWIVKCSKLTYLKIEIKNGFYLDDEFLHALARLRELVLNVENDSFFQHDFIDSERTLDYLQSLDLLLPVTEYDHFLEKLSVNLTNLCLSEDTKFARCCTIITRKTLQIICNRFTNLESLKLIFVYSISEYGSPGEPHFIEPDVPIAIENMKKLKTLQLIHVDEDTSKRLQLLLWEFQFPNLRYLKLSNVGVIDTTLLSHMVKSNPLLECLKLTRNLMKMDLSDLRVICSGWKRLNALLLDGTNVFNVIDASTGKN